VVLRFDTFGNDDHVHALSERDHRRYDVSVMLVVHKVAHEGLIHLETRDGQTLQCAEA
jgi:hypothetical protein